MKAALAVALVVLGLQAFPAEQYELKDWRLQVPLVPEKATFMAGEPVYLSFDIRNDSRQDLQVLLAADTWNWLYRPERFTIRVIRSDELRVPIRELPPGRPGGNITIGPQKIPSNGSYSFSLFITDWVDLKEPGTYTITAARTLDISEYRRDTSWQDPNTMSHLDAQASARVTVLPFDRAALADVIEARTGVMFGSDEDEALRAARALEAMNDERTVAAFSLAAAGSDDSLKWFAVGALGHFKSDEALAALKRALLDTDEDIRRSASGALSKSPHPKAIDTLLELQRDRNHGIRHDVLQTLAKMPPSESLERIRQMTQDPDEGIRVEAQRILRERMPGAR